MTKILPMFDRVIVEEDAGAAKTAGGIIIPENAQRKAYRGTIIAVGPGKRDADGELIPMDVKVGDRVIYGKYSGTDFKVEGKEYLTIPQTDIMCVIVDEAATAAPIDAQNIRMGDERVTSFEDPALTGHNLLTGN